MSADPGIVLSIVIPVYRAERILRVLGERLTKTLSASGQTYEIILVDDRSPDGSWRVIEEMVKILPGIIAVRLSRNFGQHYAITAGLDLARGEWVAVMDCDLQDQPEDIPRLLAKAHEGFDIVLARRTARRDSLYKRVVSQAFYYVFRLLSGYQMDSSVGTFRIIRHSVVEAFRNMREQSRLFGGMIQWLGFQTAYVDVEHAPRRDGTSSYNFRSLMALAIDGIVAFSNRPLYLSITVGFLMSFLSGAYGAFLIVRFLIDPRIGVAGWLSEITMTAFIGGLILLNLGMLGIYIGRIYDQTKGRPLYVIDQIITERQMKEHTLSARTI